MDNAKNAKNAKTYICDLCDFKSFKKSNFTKHINTLKHTSVSNDNKMVINDNKKMPKNATHICDYCGNIYKYLSGLCRHKKNVFLLIKKITKKV